jgi:hypothetical protein
MAGRNAAFEPYSPRVKCKQRASVNARPLIRRNYRNVYCNERFNKQHL